MGIFTYVLGSLIVAVNLYLLLEEPDEDLTTSEKVHIAFYILASWFTIAVVFISIIFCVLDYVFAEEY